MNNTKISGNIEPIPSLSNSLKDEMFVLMDSYYDGLKNETFHSDLDSKNDVIILRDEEKVIGFSSLSTFEVIYENKPIRALYSGDSIVDKNYWGKNQLLGKLLAEYMIDISSDGIESYWFLLTKGFRTYRALPTYFNTFYPNYESEMPDREKNILDIFANYKFPEEYDSGKGIFYFNGSKDKLKCGVADIDERELQNPHINYFNEINPGWRQGDELATIARIHESNYSRIFKRMFR